MNINVIQRAFRRILYKNTRMKYLFLCIGFVFTCSAYAQVVDTTLVDQRVYIDLNLKKLDSTLQVMQSLIDLQQAEIDALEAGTGEPAGNSSTAENHGTWVWSAQESTFTVPSNVTQLVVTATGSTGGSGQHASASLSGAGGTCTASGGSGGNGAYIHALLGNLTSGDTISMEMAANGPDGANSASCQSCGTGCQFSCTGDPGTAGETAVIELNGEGIIEMSGGAGGSGGTAGTSGCQNGAGGADGSASILESWVIALISGTSNEGGVSLTISW